MTIRAEAMRAPWQVKYGNGVLTEIADTYKQGVGGGTGLRPHELLEAALAACMTITLRTELATRELDDAGVGVTVDIVREDTATRFRYTLTLPPRLESERASLSSCLTRSAVRSTLSRAILFEATE